jgi:hypothetical protein
MLGVKEDQDKDTTMTVARSRAIDTWSKDYWSFLTGVDPETDKPMLWTKDEIHTKMRPYPDKPYLKQLVTDLAQPNYQPGRPDVLFIMKSRQMIVTTTIMVLSLAEMMFENGHRIILSKIIQDDAEEIIRDKFRTPYQHLPAWFKQQFDVEERPQDRVTCITTASYMLAVAENAAYRECRGGSSSRVIIDEAAFQAMSADIVEASIPMARRITLITTPFPNSPGGQFFQSQVYGRTE